MILTHALDLLNPGETAIAVFTRDMHLTFNLDGTGTSGNWKIDAAERNPDKVIIYDRHDPESRRGAIFLADFVNFSPSPEAGRQIIHFKSYRLIGITAASWQGFAEASQSPVRYLHKP